MQRSTISWNSRAIDVVTLRTAATPTATRVLSQGPEGPKTAVLGAGRAASDVDAVVDEMRPLAKLGIHKVIFVPNGDPVAYTARLGGDLAARLEEL